MHCLEGGSEKRQINETHYELLTADSNLMTFSYCREAAPKFDLGKNAIDDPTRLPAG